MLACGAFAPNETPYDGSWESLQQMPVPAWFDDGNEELAVGQRRSDRRFQKRNEHLAFTINGKKQYAIKLKKPDAPFVITGTAGGASARLLGAESLVKWTMPPQGLEVSPPVDFGQSSHAWTFQIITDHEQHMPNVIQHEAGKALKGTKEVDLEGHKRRWCICCRGKDSPLRSSRLISLTTR